MRLFALVSSLAALGATPCLALTISSAPPSRDAAQHLKPSETTGPALRDTWAGGGRPTESASFSGGNTIERSGASFDFGSVRGTMRAQPQDLRWTTRRETPAPLGLVPRR